MSNWKPSEGLKRADWIVCELCDNAAAAHNNIGAELRHRMIEVIAKALDQALADGSEHDALASVVGNGKHPVHDDYSVTGEAIGVDELSEYAKEVHRDVRKAVKAQMSALASTDFPVQVSGPEAPEPKKKRGRPKGSKAKRAKKAKATAEAPAEATS